MIKLILSFVIATTILFSNDSFIKGSGVEATKKESFENISKFNLNVSMDTSIIKSNENYYELVGDDNIIDKIKISTNNEELKFETDKSFTTTIGLKLTIYSKSISSVLAAGSMDIDIKSLSEQDLDIALTGTIDILASENSFVENLNIKTNGTVDINFKKLKSRNTKLDLSGVGEVFLNSISKPNTNIDGIYEIKNIYKATKADIRNSNRNTISTKPSSKKTTILKKQTSLDTNKVMANFDGTKESYNKLSGYIFHNDFTKFKDTLGTRNINIFNIYSPTLLYQSAINDRLDFVKSLFNKGALLTYKTSKYDETALHGAIRANKIDIASFLITSSNNLNIKNAQGQTALHLATLRGFNSLINLLLNNGANKRIKNNDGLTAYDIAKTMLEIDKKTLARLDFIKRDDIEKNKKLSNTNTGVYIGN